MDAATYLDWLTDAQIANAKHFAGWHENYTGNPTWCHEHPEKNAYHVRRLAEAMEQSGKWIGSPARLIEKPYRHAGDGNHRIRAVRWLASRGITIEIEWETS